MTSFLLIIFLLFIVFLVIIFILRIIPLSAILTNKHGIPRNWPLLGMSPALLANYNNLLDWTTSVVNRSGQCTLLIKTPSFSNLDLLLTVDPVNIQYTSSTRFSNFPRGPKSKEFFDVFGDGYFNAEAEEWSPHRKIHRAFFNHKRFSEFSLSELVAEKVEKGLIPVLDQVANGMASDGTDVIDLQELFQRYTHDLASKLITGFDPTTLSVKWPQIPFSKAMSISMEAVFMRHFLPEQIWKLQRLLGLGKEKSMNRAKQVLNEVAEHRVNTKHEELNYYQPGNINNLHDMLTTYMLEDEHYRSRAGDNVLKDSLLSLFLAAADTTSTTMSWFFWLISYHPEVKANIKTELKSILNSKHGKPHRITQQELSKLVYLHAALCETLRLYPPVPFQTRAPREADVLPTGHQANPASTLIVVPLYVMGRTKLVWGDDCAEFKPERWIVDDGSGIKYEPSHKFFTFNSGPRICLGKDLSFTIMKVAIAVMLCDYEVEVFEGQKVEPLHSVILHMKHGLRARISKKGGVF